MAARWFLTPGALGQKAPGGPPAIGDLGALRAQPPGRATLRTRRTGSPRPGGRQRGAVLRLIFPEQGGDPEATGPRLVIRSRSARAFVSPTANPPAGLRFRAEATARRPQGPPGPTAPCGLQRWPVPDRLPKRAEEQGPSAELGLGVHGRQSPGCQVQLQGDSVSSPPAPAKLLIDPLPEIRELSRRRSDLERCERQRQPDRREGPAERGAALPRRGISPGRALRALLRAPVRQPGQQAAPGGNPPRRVPAPCAPGAPGRCLELGDHVRPSPPRTEAGLAHCGDLASSSSSPGRERAPQLEKRRGRRTFLASEGAPHQLQHAAAPGPRRAMELGLTEV
uniref:basic salivary proline-rich protein 1-like n=1 Tax=Jaculus jaculus TaxID=51337 RepID=UPI001E1B2982|nr:basic salivary proline-rich protein 1-like [Jaculus jaculus]